MNGLTDFTITTSSYGWNALFGLSEQTPVLVILLISFFFFFILVLFPLYFLLGFFERKLAADLQARVGPNRTHGKGLLQVLADTLKLENKEKKIETTVFRRVSPHLKTAALYSTFAVLPFGTAMIFLDSDSSVFIPFACFGVLFLISLFASDGSIDLEDEILAHRQAFLWLSSWVPAMISVFISVVRVGSGRWSTILSSQSHGPLSWGVFSSPFGFLGFFVFLFSGLVALQLPPFHSIDRGMRHRAGSSLARFNVDQFYSLFAWCILASALFLGGQHTREISDTSFMWSAFQLVSSLVKASLLYIVLRVVARAMPQLRQDQMTEFCWRVLTPLALLSLIGEVIWAQLALVGGSS